MKLIDLLNEVLLKEEISLRLIQGGALTNPPKKLYHGTGYKISYDELNISVLINLYLVNQKQDFIQLVFLD
jgi:hypothetical protein